MGPLKSGKMHLLLGACPRTPQVERAKGTPQWAFGVNASLSLLDSHLLKTYNELYPCARLSKTG